MDIVFADKDRQEMWIDLSVRTPGAKGHEQFDSKHPGAAAARGEKDKANHYAEGFASIRSSATFHPLVWEVLGRLGSKSYTTLRRIIQGTQTGSTNTENAPNHSKKRQNSMFFLNDKWLATLSTTLQLGNARIIYSFTLPCFGKEQEELDAQPIAPSKQKKRPTNNLLITTALKKAANGRALLQTIEDEDSSAEDQ